MTIIHVLFQEFLSFNVSVHLLTHNLKSKRKKKEKKTSTQHTKTLTHKNV